MGMARSKKKLKLLRVRLSESQLNLSRAIGGELCRVLGSRSDLRE